MIRRDVSTARSLVTSLLNVQNYKKDKSKKGRFQKDIFKNKFKKSLMETWDELDNEEDFIKDEEEANLAFMVVTYSEAKSNSKSGSDSDEENEVFSKISRSDLITLIQDLSGRASKVGDLEVDPTSEAHPNVEDSEEA
ncbi:hypothetical protein KIW84_063243 [Lathyrus oleraceus]|uniref:Uncharacterized protein n=1 Tax=Pisum sativum TaxID=3888 RepID=A0A9D4W962_PEA|nr:hypothetical protein KIW84_063243 [Pisum sativum]